MPKSEHPSIETLHELLFLDAVSGRLFWKERPEKYFTRDVHARKWNGRFAGTEAMTAVDVTTGYRRGHLLGRCYRAHRIVWAMVHGRWPDKIDHIEGVRCDNRPEKMRNTTTLENNRNRRRRTDSKSGHNGVTWDARSSMWRATITVNRSTKSLGYFSKIDAAISARKVAEKLYGFHPNHGRTGYLPAAVSR